MNSRLIFYKTFIVGGICAICALCLFFMDSENWMINSGAWGTTCISFVAFGYGESRNQKEKILSPAIMWLMRCGVLFLLAMIASRIERNFLSFILFCLAFIVLWFLIIHVVASWRQRP